MPNSEAFPRRTHGRLLPAALLVLGCAAPAAAAAPRAPFWDEYQRARRAVAQSPDSLLAAAEARLAVDPHDFLAAWTAGRCAPHVRDTAAANRVARGGVDPGAGGWVVRAVLALERGKRAEARGHYERAAAAYGALERNADASRALLFAAQQGVTPSDLEAFRTTVARAESLARASGEPAAVADVLLLRGMALYEESPASARGPREEAVRLLQPLGPSTQLAEAHRGLGNVLKFAGDLEGAERGFRAAHEVASALGDAPLASQALGGLGNVQAARAEFDDALASYDRALELAHGGPPRTLLSRHGDLANLHRQLGHVSESRAHLEAAERLLGSGRGATDERIQLLDMRASLEALAGRFDAARTASDSAVELASRAGAPAQVPMLRLRQAELASELGEDEAAARCIEQGLASARAVGHRRAEILLRAMRAELLFDSGRAREALAAAETLETACEQSHPRQLGTAARIQAAALADLGRGAEALSRLEREFERARTAGDSTSAAQTLSLAAELHARRGEGRRASRLAARAYRMWKASGDSAGAFRAAAVAGAAALSAGRPGDAIRWLWPALAHEERVSSMLRASEDRAGRRAGWYEAAVTLAAAQVAAGSPGRALAVLEQTRARELGRLLSRRASGLRAHVDADLAEAVERAESELRALQSLRIQSSGAGTRGAAELSRLDARLDSVKARHADLMLRVQRSAPRYGAAASARIEADSERMRRQLGADELVFLYMVGATRTVVWRMDSRGLTARVLPRGEAWWAARVPALVTRLRSGADRHAAVAGLGDTLLGPWRQPAPVARVHVVPDGPLHDLPFDALDVTLPGRGRRTLIELAEVDAAPTAALLFADPGARPLAGGTTEIVAFGDPETRAGPRMAPASSRGGGYPAAAPLAHARREVNAIRAVFPGARVYTGAEATESRFFEQARRCAIVHVAAHGFVDDHRPAYSGLALAPDRESGRPASDGLVQAFEVAGATIGAELATLSACESGAGTLRRGEGLQGLARAFQIAGARRVLASLWQVEDVETADLMATFYRGLAGGATPATALRAAKLESLARQGGGGGTMRGVGTRPRAAGHAASATWAAFVLLGPRSER